MMGLSEMINDLSMTAIRIIMTIVMTLVMTIVLSNDNSSDNSHGFIINNHDDGFIAIYSMIMTIVLICTQ